MEQIQRTSDALRAASFTDIRCIECLLRFYDVRTEYYSLPALPEGSTEIAQHAAKDAGAVKAGSHGVEEAAAGLEDKQQEVAAVCDIERDVNPNARDAAEVVGADEKKDVKNGSGEGRGVKRKQHGSGFNHQQYTPWISDGSGAGKKLEKLVTIPRLQTKGHTGYLLFGRKPVCEEEQHVNGSGVKDVGGADAPHDS